MQLLFLLSTMRQLYIMLFLTSMNCSMSNKGRVVIVLDPPWADLFETESIILKCKAEDGSSGWKYEWAKENKGMLEKLKNTTGSNGDTYKIDSVKEYDSGIYWCQAERETEKTESASCTLNVLKGRPGVSITLQPPFTIVYVGEWLSLKCEVKETSAGWKYSWAAGTDSNLIQVQHLPDVIAIGTELRFKPVNLSHQRRYWCQASRKSFQSTSSSFLLEISDKVPMVLLSIQPSEGPIFTGETVSMKCELDEDSAGWIYIWYKGIEHNFKFYTNSSRDPAGSNHYPKQDHYVITQSRISDSDVYRCQAERPATHFFSKFSETATLKISNPPKPRLTTEKKWMKVYLTEKVSLKCVIENFTSDWIYTWYKDGIEQNACRNSETCSVYTINSVAEQHSGNYTCRANAHSKYSEISDPLSLHVFKNGPQLILWSSSVVTYTGIPVNLSCMIMGESSKWEILWYKESQQLYAEDQDNTEVSNYIIVSANVWDSGKYCCQAKREEFLSSCSNQVEIQVFQSHLKPMLIIEPDERDIYREDKFIITCRFNETITGWNFSLYKDGLKVTHSSPYTVSSAKSSDSGEYWCEAESKLDANVKSNQSNALNITVQALPEALLTQMLRSEIFNIIVKGQVTLKCETEWNSTDWKYIWFRNTAVVNEAHQGSLYIVYTGHDSYGVEYRCRGQQLTKPSYSEYSEAVTPSVTVLKVRLIAAASLIIVLLICGILLKCGCKRLLRVKGTDKKGVDPSMNMHNSDYSQPTDATFYSMTRLNFKTLDLATKNETSNMLYHTIE